MRDCVLAATIVAEYGSREKPVCLVINGYSERAMDRFVMSIPKFLRLVKTIQGAYLDRGQANQSSGVLATAGRVPEEQSFAWRHRKLSNIRQHVRRIPRNTSSRNTFS